MQTHFKSQFGEVLMAKADHIFHLEYRAVTVLVKVKSAFLYISAVDVG